MFLKNLKLVVFFGRYTWVGERLSVSEVPVVREFADVFPE